MDGGGRESFISPLEVVKRQKAPLGRNVSSNFVADCSFIAVDGGHWRNHLKKKVEKLMRLSCKERLNWPEFCWIITHRLNFARFYYAYFGSFSGKTEEGFILSETWMQCFKPFCLTFSMEKKGKRRNGLCKLKSCGTMRNQLKSSKQFQCFYNSPSI